MHATKLLVLAACLFGSTAITTAERAARWHSHLPTSLADSSVSFDSKSKTLFIEALGPAPTKPELRRLARATRGNLGRAGLQVGVAILFRQSQRSVDSIFQPQTGRYRTVVSDGFSMVEDPADFEVSLDVRVLYEQSLASTPRSARCKGKVKNLWLIAKPITVRCTLRASGHESISGSINRGPKRTYVAASGVVNLGTLRPGESRRYDFSLEQLPAPKGLYLQLPQYTFASTVEADGREIRAFLERENAEASAWMKLVSELRAGGTIFSPKNAPWTPGAKHFSLEVPSEWSAMTVNKRRQLSSRVWKRVAKHYRDHFKTSPYWIDLTSNGRWVGKIAKGRYSQSR